MSWAVPFGWMAGIAVTATFGMSFALADALRCGDRALTFADWREWPEVTTGPIVSPGHSANYVRIYVNELARDSYVEARAPFPVCATILKTSYGHEKDGLIKKLTIMVKMSPGYDPDHGDWWYATTDETGSKRMREGRVNECIACHKHAAETDYLFSKEVMEAVKE